MSLKSFLSFILVFMLTFPGIIFANETEKQPTELLQQYQLKVSGLTCKRCIPDVRKALSGISGVRDVEVTRFEKNGSSTVVEATPGSVSSEQLILVLRMAGLQGEVLAIGEPREIILKKRPVFKLFEFFN